MLVDLDVSEIATPEALQVLLESRLGFPGYNGRNWDAFWDCITDPDQSAMPDVLRVTGWERLAKRLPRDAALMRERRRRRFTCCWSRAWGFPVTTAATGMPSGTASLTRSSR